MHRSKKVREFPVPSRDVTTKLSLGGNNDVITELFLPRGSLVSDIPAGDGKLVNLFLRSVVALTRTTCKQGVGCTGCETPLGSVQVTNPTQSHLQRGSSCYGVNTQVTNYMQSHLKSESHGYGIPRVNTQVTNHRQSHL
jgi:hypothetical protein